MFIAYLLFYIYIYIRVDIVILYFVNIEIYTVRTVGMLLVEHDNFFRLFIWRFAVDRS